MTALALSAAARRAFERMAADFRRIFGPRFVALVAYGPGAAAAFASEITVADLDALAVLTEQWHREGLDTPLVMTPEEFGRSLDAFPIEYQAMIDRHALIAGTAPFAGAEIASGDLRRACEVQAKSHLIQVRQGWLEAGGHTHELADMIARSAEALRVLLTNLARLHGETAGDAGDLAAFAEARVGMPRDLVAAILETETAPEKGRALVDRLPEYVAASQQLWTFVDTWRAR